MSPRKLVTRTALVALLTSAVAAVILIQTPDVLAQAPFAADAGIDAAAAPAVAGSVPIPGPISAPSTEPESRPVRGPAVRERAGRRSRGASTASGALMLTMLIAGFAYYVIKRIRR